MKPRITRIFGIVIIGAKTLDAKLETAKEAGRDENRRLTSRVMSALLKENTEMTMKRRK